MVEVSLTYMLKANILLKTSTLQLITILVELNSLEKILIKDFVEAF
jgi:hypothetical protein